MTADALRPSPAESAGRRRLRAATLLAGASLTVMAGATIAPTLPALERAFAGDRDVALHARLVLTLPALFIALGSPLAGWLSDRVGRFRPLAVGLVLYALAGTSGLWVESLAALLAGRAALGLAVALISTNVLALVGDHMRGARRQRFLGLQASSMAFGGVVFLLLGGFLAESGWRAPFAVYASSLLLLPLAWSTLRRPPPAEPSSGRDAAASDGAGPWRPTLALVCALGFVGMATFYMVPVQVPFLLAAHGGTGSSATGAALALNNLVAAAVGMTYWRLRDRLDQRAIHALHFALVAAGYLVLAEATSFAALCVGLAVGGLGFGLLMPNLNTWLLASVPAPVRARAVGALGTAIFLGQFSSPLLVAPLGRRLGVDGQFAAVAGGLLVLAGLFALAARRARAASS